ncbi:MAG: ABC transporter ATP-binding protein [Bacteroidia bacterium]|nr:ABC transporter ATP-binding protein [Bacteroidia bacterium]
MNNLPLIKLEDFGIEFVKGRSVFTAARNINFEVNAGEITGIVGESGSGKSVTCMSILKLHSKETKYSGKILFNDNGKITECLSSSNKTLRKLAGKSIAYIFQEPMTALNPVRTCGSQLLENILIGGLKGKQAREKAISLLTEVQMPDPERIFRSYPHEISGGQRQRVMIAMSISCDPVLLIADEPTTALDRLVQNDILTLISNLSINRGMAVILISHDFEVIAKYTTKTIVMYKGSIAEQGETVSIINNPQQDYTKALLACRPSAVYEGKYLPVLKDFADGATFTPQAWPVTEKKDDELLTLTRVYKSFKSGSKFFVAVDGISFEIKKGETLGLIGESGSGKSTVAKMIIRLEDISSGEILYESTPVTKIKNYPRVAQMIFQDPYSSLNPSLTIGNTIGEVVELHQKISGEEKLNTVHSLLEKVGLKAEDALKYPNEFSGGQRQRIGIARALAAKPEFIICDESVSALDLSVQAQVLNLLKKLQAENNLTYLFITHDMNVLRYFADRIVVMKNGRVVEKGDTKRLTTNPENDYTRLLLQN